MEKSDWKSAESPKIEHKMKITFSGSIWLKLKTYYIRFNAVKNDFVRENSSKNWNVPVAPTPVLLSIHFAVLFSL